MMGGGGSCVEGGIKGGGGGTGWVKMKKNLLDKKKI